MKQVKIKLVLLTILLLSCFLVASADQDLEKRYLSKIHHELAALKPFLDRARSNAATANRYRFDHERLSLILKRIMLDIELHVNSENRTPYERPNSRFKKSSYESQREGSNKITSQQHQLKKGRQVADHLNKSKR